MNYKILLLITIVFSPTSAIHGQDSTSHYPFYDTGIFTEYGSGIYSMKDESFSSVKYSGRMPYFSAGFSRFHNNYGSCLGITYNSSSKILNNSISADVLNFSLFHDFQYPIGSFNLFSKDVYCYLGPSTEFYLFYNKQNFANSGLYFNYSIFSLASLGINSMMILPISQRFQATGTVRASLLSLGLRMPEIMTDTNNEEAPVKLMTAYSGMNTTLSIGLKYYIIRSLSLSFKYRLQLAQIRAWDENMISAADYITFTISYHIKTRDSI